MEVEKQIKKGVRAREVYLNVAKHFTIRAWVNPAKGGASGRTFHPMSTLVSSTCRSSPQVESSHSLKTSNQPPSEALKSGLSMAGYVTVRFILRESERRIERSKMLPRKLLI